MAEVIRVSIHGTLPGGEVWSVNPTYDVNTSAPVTGEEATAAAAAICALTLPTGLKAIMGAQTFWTGALVEARQFNGNLEARGEALRADPTGGVSAAFMPYQSALVLSLMTSLPGGRGRGRLYWPALTATLNSGTLRVDPTEVTNFVNGFNTFLGAIGTALDGIVDGGVALGVWSRANASISLVTKLRAGNVLDTQRRRRDSIPESYTMVDFIP